QPETVLDLGAGSQHRHHALHGQAHDRFEVGRGGGGRPRRLWSARACCFLDGTRRGGRRSRRTCERSEWIHGAQTEGRNLGLIRDDLDDDLVVADVEPVPVAQRLRDRTRGRLVRRVDEGAVRAGILEVESAARGAHPRMAAGHEVLRVRKHPVVAGNAADGAAALVKYLVRGRAQLAALSAYDAEGEQHQEDPPALAQSVADQLPVSIPTNPAGSGKPREHSQLAVSVLDPSVHQIASGASSRPTSRCAYALTAFCNEAADARGICQRPDCAGASPRTRSACADSLAPAPSSRSRSSAICSSKVSKSSASASSASRTSCSALSNQARLAQATASTQSCGSSRASTVSGK